MFKKNNIILFLAIFILISTIIYFVFFTYRMPVKNSLGAIAPVVSVIPFGGKIQEKKECTCGDAPRPLYLLEIGPPVGGTFIVTSQTNILATHDVNKGNWTIGIAKGQDKICKVSDDEGGCWEEGSGPAIKIMGTSSKR